MKIHNAHERVVTGTPAEVAALVADFDAIWPVDIARAPRYFGEGVYAAHPMVWEEGARTDAVRAFRVIHPPELDAEHWFEVHGAPGGALLRHVIAEARCNFGRALARPARGDSLRILEALLDRVAAKVTHSLDTKGAGYR